MFKRVTQSPMKERETSAATAPAALRMTMTVEEMAAAFGALRRERRGKHAG